LLQKDASSCAFLESWDQGLENRDQKSQSPSNPLHSGCQNQLSGKAREFSQSYLGGPKDPAAQRSIPNTTVRIRALVLL
jgi:hypothetical protein